MGDEWRETTRVAAADLTAEARPPHEFGPAPVGAPSPGIGFQSAPDHAAPESPLVSRSTGGQAAHPETPTVETLTEPEPSPTSARDEEEDLDVAPQPRHAALVRATAPPVEAPVAQAAGDARTTLRPGRHRREDSAISGTVRSTRGRGLRGMQVAVLDDAWQVVGTAVTGVGGAFIVEDVPVGAYRVTATDELDGDFGAAWHNGSSYEGSGVLRVKEGRTRRNVDITLASTAAVAVEVDVRRKKAIVGIRVTERATGIRAGGAVRISTKRFSTELPLTKGRAAITLLGTAEGSPRLSKKVRVDYLGTEHVQRGSATARLR